MTPKQERPTLSTRQHDQARAYLAQPDLLERTSRDIGRSGVVGEEINRLLMYLVFTSRLRQRPLHLVCLGQSGMGKTYLQESLGRLIPPEDRLEITALSENALYYFGRKELRHKLILMHNALARLMRRLRLRHGFFKSARQLRASRITLWLTIYARCSTGRGIAT